MPPGALARSMIELRSQNKTGRLRVDADGTRTFVYLRSGVPIFAEEGSSGETLGRLLVRLGMLTQQQYVEVLSVMTGALVFNEQIRFGETAVELGYLTEDVVHRALHDQVRWKVIRCFQRSEVAWTFEEGEALVEDVGEFPMFVESLVYEATVWLDQEHRLDVGLRDVLDAYVFVPYAERGVLATRLGRDHAAAGLFRLLDGRSTARELCAMSFAGDLDVEAALATLVILGEAHFLPTARDAVDEPTGPTMKSPVSPTTTTPPKLDRKRTSQVLQQIDAMLRSLKVDDLDLFKEPASDHERRLIAEQAYQRGRGHLSDERLEPAKRACGRAVELEPTNAEYRLASELAQLSEAIETEEAARSRLQAAALAAVKQDPNLALAHYVLGRCALASDDAPAAVRHLRRARTLDRSLLSAERHLRIAIRRSSGG